MIDHLIEYIIGGLLGATIGVVATGWITYTKVESLEEQASNYRTNMLDYRAAWLRDVVNLKTQPRDDTIRDMHSVCSNVKSRKKLLTKRMEALYDAGYRKVVEDVDE